MLTVLASGAMLGLLNLTHCAAMCGPLSSAACARTGGSGLLRYQLGRTTSYAFAGALSGHLGRALRVLQPGPVSAWIFAALTASACLLTARALLRPAAAERQPLITLRVSATPARRSLSATLLRLVPKEPWVFGLLSALLPCGVLAAALLAAVAAGSPQAGAILMVGFAASSGSAVLAAAFLTQHAPQRFAHAFKRAVASLLVVGAVLAIARPLRAIAHPTDASHASAIHCH